MLLAPSTLLSPPSGHCSLLPPPCSLLPPLQHLFRDETVDWHSNIWTGLVGVLTIFMIVSVLTLPNGPFIRPHPALWRCVLGLSILYLLMLQFLVHQDYRTIRLELWGTVNQSGQ